MALSSNFLLTYLFELVFFRAFLAIRPYKTTYKIAILQFLLRVYIYIYIYTHTYIIDSLSRLVTLHTANGSSMAVYVFLSNIITV